MVEEDLASLVPLHWVCEKSVNPQISLWINFRFCNYAMKLATESRASTPASWQCLDTSLLHIIPYKLSPVPPWPIKTSNCALWLARQVRYQTSVPSRKMRLSSDTIIDSRGFVLRKFLSWAEPLFSFSVRLSSVTFRHRLPNCFAQPPCLHTRTSDCYRDSADRIPSA